MKALSCGDAAVLFEVGTLDEAVALAAAVRAAELSVVVDVVPAARTVLVVTAPGADLGALRRTVSGLPVSDAAVTREADPVEISVVYDGPDLDEIASFTGLTVDEVIAVHTGSGWRVAFAGFSPGFAYLVDGDPRLQVPRRDEPRTRVPAGAVGLAGEFSAVYPRATPGGWQLLGHTDATLWDTDRDPPALLAPGDRVRFVQVER
ncbi:MAG: carboxyltransferase domain-containing protein [Pseudonocardia sp.]|uniref:5-oxoprolinase subunit B family protein n=1 Tax=unclassified Pseudonocardia TaxID=2619320 RepID=UPI0008699F45|nr:MULTISPECIES: carboxyltransferase domain-containing protein [unclassified Pseudonocardia]MBN9113263.1 carboxyltransferase domain-containing protein [Pseudonocardia sp.]ODU19717.1 MAG: allophanate hydrolase [Pseudonocardia sp. SCN 72-51]ODV00854.1 MAG: allophanate hydrolase [Pseudonocardia sp. SCN 73-27]